jgi:hypothetical protein
MARKAVQGYPEKSYYDNTRYLGIVATTDPLNEGLFKHMVNFDVSDTGQSVEPREGYLTTTLKNTIPTDPAFNNHISLSNKTIIYKDNTIGQYILFDLDNNTAYIAEISGYNDKITNYYLPIISKIANYDWNYLFTQVLIPQVTYVAAYRSTTTLAATITQFINKITLIEDTKIEHIYDENGIDLELLKELKEEKRVRLSEYTTYKPMAKYIPVEEYAQGTNGVYSVPCFAAFPSATQNELTLNDAKTLIANGIEIVTEGANMPTTPEATILLQKEGILFAPAKAANAGGVAVG